MEAGEKGSEKAQMFNRIFRWRNSVVKENVLWI